MRIPAWLYNLVFRWLHKDDAFVRVWQEGERCSGCDRPHDDNDDLTAAYMLGYENGKRDKAAQP